MLKSIDSDSLHSQAINVEIENPNKRANKLILTKNTEHRWKKVPGNLKKSNTSTNENKSQLGYKVGSRSHVQNEYAIMVQCLCKNEPKPHVLV